MAQNRVVRGIVLIEVAFVVGGVDDGFSGRDVGGHAVPGQARSDSEHHVGLAQEVIHRASHDPTTGAQGEGMVFWEGTLALQGGHHRYVQQLRQFHQFSTGLGVQYPLTGMDHRPAGLQQYLGRLGDILGIASRVGGFNHSVRVHDGVIHFLQGNIGRYFDHYWPRASHLQQIEGAPHHFGDLLRLVERFHPLGDRGIGAGGTEEREDLRPVALVAQGQNEHRDRIGVGGGHAWEGVLRAWTILHGKGADTLAIGDARKAIGNAHADALLPAQYGPNTYRRCRINKGRGGVGTEKLHPFALQNVGNRINDFHPESSCGDEPCLCPLSRGERHMPAGS